MSPVPNEEVLKDELAKCYRLISSRNAEALEVVNVLLEKAMAMDFSWKVKSKIAEAHYFLAIPCNYVRALEIALEVEALLAGGAHTTFYPTVFSIKASCYSHLGQIDKAEEFYLKSISAFDRLEEKLKSDYHRLGSNYCNLVKLEQSNGMYPETFEAHIQRAIMAFEQAESSSGLSNCYNLLAEKAYLSQHFETALDIMFKALSINEQAKGNAQSAIICNNISRIYAKMGQFGLSHEWYEKGLNKTKHIESAYVLGSFLCQRMEVLVLEGRVEEAIVFGLQSAEAFQKIDSVPDLCEVYRELGNCYALNKDFEQAYHYLHMHLALNKQLSTNEKVAAIAKSRQAFEWEQKEKDNALLQQKAKEIQTYARQLEIKNDDLNHFTHAMSHDLKEPLRTIHSMLTLLERSFEDALSPVQQEYIQFVHEAVVRLTELVDSVLDYSRLSSGNHQAVDLNTILQLSKSNLAALLLERSAVIETVQLPTVKGDETHLMQLFQNLISNAIKYNDSQPPIVQIQYERKGNKEIISIADNGIGIPEKFHARIFELFQRLHSKAEYSGSGVGLAVCKKIMQQINGSIYVTSNPTGGSIFYLEFVSETEQQ